MLANKYYKYIKIAPSEEESSGMNLSTIGANGNKDIVLLNTFAKTYIQYGLDLKNSISDNTVKFIDEQVIGIQDSLDYAEDLLQRFRSKNKVIDLGAKDAVYLLESFGLNVQITGLGAVRYQSIAPGTKITENMIVKLELRQ